MKGKMEILESCDVVHGDEAAQLGRFTVRLVDGQPVRLVTPEGQEGPVVRIGFPLPQMPDQNVVVQAAHILMDRPDTLGLAAVDDEGAVQGVVLAERLRRLIVRATEAQAEDARKEVARELGLEEETAVEVLKTLGGLRGLFDYVPGPPGPPVPAVTVYVCPTEGCEFMFVPHQEGQPIPQCPTHHCALVKKKLGG